MRNNKLFLLLIGLIAGALLLSACGESSASNDEIEIEDNAVSAVAEKYAPGGSYSFEVDPMDYEPIEAHKDLNQEPVPVKMERIAEDEVNIEMTA
jgi:nitrite reductase (NO-forming)